MMPMPYTDSDLAYNRRGELSPEQIVRIQKGWRNLLIVGSAFAAFMFTLGVIFYLTGDPAGLIATWLFAGVIVLVLVGFNRLMRRVQRPGEVAMIQGEVRREVESDEGTKRYFLRVGGLRLMMEEAEYANFEDGATYCVYYLPRTKYIASAEVC